MKSMNPHIVFAGNAREAFGFYRSIFGGELEVILVGDRYHDGLPPDAVFHADLQGENFRIMGADGNASVRDGFSMHLQCEDKAELESFFQALSDHGTGMRRVSQVIFGAGVALGAVSFVTALGFSGAVL